MSAGFAYLPEVPDWLLATLFDCAATNVACGDPTGGPAAVFGGRLPVPSSG